MAKFKYLTSDDARVTVFWVRGAMTISAMNAAYIQEMSHKPARMEYALLLDLRRWEGMATDNDLAESSRRLARMRAGEGLKNTVPDVVYLGLPGSGLEFLAQAMNKIRGGGVTVETSPIAAWKKLTPSGVPMPGNIKTLLGV